MPKICLCVCFFRVIPFGGEKNINKIPPKITGQSRENVVYMFFCLCVVFAPEIGSKDSFIKAMLVAAEEIASWTDSNIKPKKLMPVETPKDPAMPSFVWQRSAKHSASKSFWSLHYLSDKSRKCRILPQPSTIQTSCCSKGE